MRFEQCRATFFRLQALVALLAATAGCGQERPATPLSPLSSEVADTAGVLRAVASAILEMNARAESARTSPDYAAYCRRRGMPCWMVPMNDWQIASHDRATLLLADLLGVNASKLSPPADPPLCVRASFASQAYRTDVLLRFASPDRANVYVGHRCHWSERGETRGYLQEETFEVRRTSGTWKATPVSYGVT